MATAISEYATLLLGLGLAWRVMRIREISLLMLQQAWRGNLRRLLALNRDIMVNVVLMNLLAFSAYALDGFAYAVEAHSGHAYGARDNSQLRKIWHAAWLPVVRLAW